MSPFSKRATLVALLAINVLSACDDPPKAPPRLVCSGDFIAEGGRCVPAQPTCEEGVPGSLVEKCLAENRTCYEDQLGALCGICLDGYVEEGGNCRPAIACADLDCESEGRSCLPSEGRRDARCGSCLPGAFPNADRCVFRTCSLTETEGSIAAECASQNRHCVEPGDEEAMCGDCYPGFVEHGGSCRPVRTCSELGCVAANRSCTPAGPNSDASCGACRAGFREMGGHCAVMHDTACSDESEYLVDLRDACAAEHRGCEEEPLPPHCGDCEDGFVFDSETGTCQRLIPCAELSCESLNRHCTEDPQGRCTTCLSGFIQDVETGDCRPTRTCAETTCGAEEDCVEGTEFTDARCTPSCGPGQLWGGTQCSPCPPCTGPGEDGRWPFPSSGGSCICKTQPGYFYTTAGDVGTFPCDADGDGWVRESARSAMESSDPVLRENARCTLRTIDRVELINESGQSKVIDLDFPLELYESDRNDDQALLEVHWRGRGLPSYAGRERVSARELNRMTKLCHDPRTDYNDNGIPDVAEWSGHTLGPTLRPEQAPFNEFSYFMELYRGYYRDPSDLEAHGRWVIEEKSRQPALPGRGHFHVPLSYDDQGNDYWRECRVDVDPRWNTVGTPVGMDFARYSDPLGFAGMNHHSQFKCFVVDNEPNPGFPQEITRFDITETGYHLNRCSSLGPVLTEEGNPADPLVTCEPVSPDALRPGDVIWGAVPYRDYGPTPYQDYPGADMGAETYQGGCVNPCVERVLTCPRYDVNPIAIACGRDPDNFGKLLEDEIYEDGCTSWEVCDGEDNDGDGVIDNGDPGGGFDCDTGRLGICQPGTTHCIDGEVQCVQDEPERLEVCNGVDDDCDGEIDVGFIVQPNECVALGLPPSCNNDTTCAVPGLKGECAKGRIACDSFPDGDPPSGEVTCAQVNQPVEEDCNSPLDLDCDGDPLSQWLAH